MKKILFVLFATLIMTMCAVNSMAVIINNVKCPGGHSWVKKVVEPTCTEQGYVEETCNGCGRTHTSYTPATGHTFVVTKVKEPTCTVKGYSIYTCEDCGITDRSDYVDKIPHDYEAIVTEPTCVAVGYTSYVCKLCEDTYKDNETALTDHTYGELMTDADGGLYKSCSECGEIEYQTLFSISDSMAKPGQNVKLTLSFRTDELINSIAISEIEYDSDILEFVGFADYEHIEEVSSFPPLFDSEKMCIIIGFIEETTFDGDICTLEFKVKQDATEGVTTVSATPLVKYNYTEIDTAFKGGELTVYAYIKGDIDLDEDVDIDDASLLFYNSMLPSYYTIDYVGTTDFNADGYVDIQDAVLLFNYSMMPDLFPLA